MSRALLFGGGGNAGLSFDRLSVTIGPTARRAARTEAEPASRTSPPGGWREQPGQRRLAHRVAVLAVFETATDHGHRNGSGSDRSAVGGGNDAGRTAGVVAAQETPPRAGRTAMTGMPPPSDKFGFPATRWDLVHAAADSESARNELLTLYYRPILAFFRALARNEAIAEELRQSFLLSELTRLSGEARQGVVRRADPNKGRFRDYLKQALRHHWLSSLRGRHDNTSPLPDNEDTWHPRIEDAERAFVRTWVRQVLVVALRSVESICRTKHQDQHFAIFTAYHFPPASIDVSWETLAEQFGLRDGKTARNRAATAQAHLRSTLAGMLLREHPDAALSDEVLDILSILGDDDA